MSIDTRDEEDCMRKKSRTATTIGCWAHDEGKLIPIISCFRRLLPINESVLSHPQRFKKMDVGLSSGIRLPISEHEV